jgi:hypothetical protein
MQGSVPCTATAGIKSPDLTSIADKMGESTCHNELEYRTVTATSFCVLLNQVGISYPLIPIFLSIAMSAFNMQDLPLRATGNNIQHHQYKSGL